MIGIYMQLFLIQITLCLGVAWIAKTMELIRADLRDNLTRPPVPVPTKSRKQA